MSKARNHLFTLATLTALTALTATGAVSGVTPATAATSEPIISVGPDLMSVGAGQAAQPIQPTLIGGNHRWANSGMGMWDAGADSAMPGFVDAARAANLGSIRYPGGTVANMFDFKAAIGPYPSRGCQTGAGFVGGVFQPTDSDYGPDENERVAAAVGAETMIMVPMINQSAQDAADYVEYMNAEVGTNPNGGIAWAARRAANGHPEPYGISTWEVGNEPYFPNQRYWRSTDDEKKLAQFIEGGWQRQTADSPPYDHNDGLFAGCDLADPVVSNGQPEQSYKTRYQPIVTASDATAESGPIADPVLRVNGEVWQLVEDFAGQPADAKVFTVNGPKGTVGFGDGVNGAIPAEGAEFSIEYTTAQDGFVDYYEAIKSVDPSVSVCSGWGRPEFPRAMGDKPYDCVGFHMYMSPHGGDEEHPVFNTEQLYQEITPMGAVAVGKLVALKQAIEAARPDPATRPSVIVTEWGTLNRPGPTGKRPPRGFNAMLMSAMYRCELAIGMIENDVQLATLSNLNGGPRKGPSGVAGVLGGTPDYFVTGLSQMMNLIEPMIGSRAVETTVSDNPVATDGEYATFRVLSTRGSDGVVRVLVINRDITEATAATVDLVDSAGSREVTVTTFNADTVDAFDTFEDRDQITTAVRKLGVDSPTLDHTFPAHSITLLEFR